MMAKAKSACSRSGASFGDGRKTKTGVEMILAEPGSDTIYGRSADHYYRGAQNCGRKGFDIGFNIEPTTETYPTIILGCSLHTEENTKRGAAGVERICERASFVRFGVGGE